MYINVEELLDFLERKYRWPMHVDPGRESGKTETAIKTALQHACKVGMPALYVAPNRSALRQLELKWKPFISKRTLELTSYANLDEFIMGRRYSCVIFDEPGLVYSYGAAAKIHGVGSLLQCSTIIFGN